MFPESFISCVLFCFLMGMRLRYYLGNHCSNYKFSAFLSSLFSFLEALLESVNKNSIFCVIFNKSIVAKLVRIYILLYVWGCTCITIKVHPFSHPFVIGPGAFILWVLLYLKEKLKDCAALRKYTKLRSSESESVAHNRE